MGVGGKFPKNHGLLQGPSGEGTGPGLLPVADQKHFGCGPGECSRGRVALSGAGDPRIHCGKRGRGKVVGGENQRVDGVSGDPCR